MKLYYSPNSPFARVARVAAIECELAPLIEHVEVVNRSADNPLLEHSPVCRVPTLVDGTLVLGEARNICAYFDHIADEPRFLSSSQSSWLSLSFESMALGFLDAAGVWVRENRRDKDQVSTFILGVEEQRAKRCLDHFEVRLSPPTDRPISWDFGGIAIGCALGILDHNSLLQDWRSSHPYVADWYREQSKRESMLSTCPR